MNDRRHLLKIKLKTLAAEAKIIRTAERRLQEPMDRFQLLPKAATKEEWQNDPSLAQAAAKVHRLAAKMQRARTRAKSWYGDNRFQLESMHNHRVSELREEARATHLAYGFIRGKTFQQIEGNRMIKYLFEGQPTADEARVLESAKRMAWFYGPLNKSESKTMFDSWLKARSSRLAFAGSNVGLFNEDLTLPDGGAPNMVTPTEYLEPPTDSGGTAPALTDKR